MRELQGQARERLLALGRKPRLRVLLTGATGFLGKELLAQAADHPHVSEVVCVVRPETIRDRRLPLLLTKTEIDKGVDETNYEEWLAERGASA